eukprot:1929700-Pyramimonas_sp.AAC.1
MIVVLVASTETLAASGLGPETHEKVHQLWVGVELQCRGDGSGPTARLEMVQKRVDEIIAPAITLICEDLHAVAQGDSDGAEGK